jgi:hypothetical protein
MDNSHHFIRPHQAINAHDIDGWWCYSANIQASCWNSITIWLESIRSSIGRYLVAFPDLVTPQSSPTAIKSYRLEAQNIGTCVSPAGVV